MATLFQTVFIRSVLGGLVVTDSFIKPDQGKFTAMPSGSWLGGHAIVLCGWDDNMTHAYTDGRELKGFFRLRNSWGQRWGEGGYSWLPYDFVTFRDLDLGMPYFMEAWSSVDIILPPEAAKEVILWVGQKKALVDGFEVALEQEPTIDQTSGRTLIPLRFLSEVLNYRVQWFEAERKIVLSK